MAAQSARDRKKMKMQDLEGDVHVLRRNNIELIKRNSYLEKRVRALEEQNQLLKKKLGGGDASVSTSSSMEESLYQLMAASMDVEPQVEQEDWSDAEDVIYDDVELSEGLNGGYLDGCESSDGSNSDVSEDSGLMMALVDTTSSITSSPKTTTPNPTSAARRSADESFESAELINEPQQKVQDLEARRKAQARAAAEAEDAEETEVRLSRLQRQSILESKQSAAQSKQVRSTVITSTSSRHSSTSEEQNPLDLKISSSTSKATLPTKRSSSRACPSPRSTATFPVQKLMNFLIPLLSMAMNNSNPSSMSVLADSLLETGQALSQLSSNSSRLSATSRPSKSSSPRSTSAQHWNSLVAAACKEADKRSRIRQPRPPDQ